MVARCNRSRELPVSAAQCTVGDINQSGGNFPALLVLVEIDQLARVFGQGDGPFENIRRRLICRVNVMHKRDYG